jgi:subtilisin family serine protease
MKKIALHIFICIAFASQSLAQIDVDNGFISNQLYVKIIPPTAQSTEVQYIPHPDNPNMGRNAWDIITSYGGMSMTNAFSTNYKPLQNVYIVTLKKGSDIDGLITALNRSYDVDFAERIPVYSLTAIPIDLDESKQWYFKTINMNQSWSSVQANSWRNKTIAVIDDGVLYDHSDLSRSIAINYEDTFGDGIDNDGNGYVDDFFGWNVLEGNGNTKPYDIPKQVRKNNEKFGWHGTHVAGIIGATNDNNIGIASLGINNRILPIKSITVDGKFLAYLAAAIDYAIARKADIINCSFTSPNYSQTIQDKIHEARSKGIIIIAAAGNDGDTLPAYPAAYDGVIAVGATTRDDKILGESNYGSYVDVMAPGHEIYSTASTDVNSYGYLSGTSMAAPMVSGLAGLILSMEPHRVDRIEEIIKGGCDNIDDKNPLYRGRMGAGRINVDKSFEYMLFMDNPASVLEKSKYTDFNIYPNPTSNQFFVPFHSISKSGKVVSVEILNTVGAQVAQQDINYQNQPISVTQLAQGIYQVVVTNANGENYRSRLIVNR